MFLPITATIQTSVQNRGEAGDRKLFLDGLRAVEWFCCGCMALSLAVTIIGLRHMGKVGLLKKLGTVKISAPKKEESEV